MEPLEPSAVPALPETITKRRAAIWLYVIILGAPAAIGVIFAAGVILLAWHDRTMPDGIWAILGGIVSGLLGIPAAQQLQPRDRE